MPKKEKAPTQTGAEGKENSNRILADSATRVKKKTPQIYHSQEITDPDGVVLSIVLKNATVSITDKNGNTISFSTYLVPELRSTLLDIEKEFGRGLSHEQV